MAILIFILSFLILIIIGFPISATIGFSSIIGIIASGGSGYLYIIVQQLSEGIQKYSLLAIPFFILAGNIMNKAGITTALFDFASKLVGHLKGGLAQVNVIASMLFAGSSGAAVADAAGLGLIEVKAMSEKGYSKSYSAAITLASSVVGPLIPPSIPLVIYGIVAQESIARLLISGIIPGFLAGLFLMITNYIYAIRTTNLFPKPEPRVKLKEILSSLKYSFPALLSPIIIIGTLMSGFVTATEAGVIAVLYSLLIGVKYRGIKNMILDLPEIFKDSSIMSVTLGFVLANATAMSWFLTRERVPTVIANALFQITDSPIVFLLLLCFFYLVIGTLMEGITAMLVSVPILLPVAQAYGITTLHFGMVTVYALLLGMFTPPVGTGLFIMTKVAKIEFEDMVKAFIPFYLPLLILLFLITFFPGIWDWLPELLM